MSKKIEPDLRPEVEIELDFPVTIDGEKSTSITMRRPKGGDHIWMEKQKGAETEKMFAMVARLCNVTPEFVAEMDDFDIAKADAQYGAFRGDVAPA